ncbi:transposase [Leucobacter chromiireducens]|nr:transposase [Leucobacter chromiireducens]
MNYRGRNMIERDYCRLKQWWGLAARYDELAIAYRAAVALNGMIVSLNLLRNTP